MENRGLYGWLVAQKTHFIVWLCFVFYETVVVGLLNNSWGNPITYFLHYSVTIFLFYLFALVTLPWAVARGKSAFLIVPIVVLAQLILYITMHYLTDLVLIATGVIKLVDKDHFGNTFLLRNSYRGLYFMGFATGFYYLSKSRIARLKQEESERLQFQAIIAKEKTEKELVLSRHAFLKAQINPHFLFNTLNFIQIEVAKSSPVASEAVIRLSEMMHYAIAAEQLGEQILLEQEIEQVEHLLFLYQVRWKQHMVPNFVHPGQVGELYFVPLVLITLVENMFKHGDFTVPGTAKILVYIDEDRLFILTENLIGNQKALKSSNAGLSNIEKRLRYAYGEALRFSCLTQHNVFTVQLSVPVALLSLPNGSAGFAANNDRE